MDLYTVHRPVAKSQVLAIILMDDILVLFII